MNSKDFALIFKCMSDATRLEILSLLKSGEMCACTLLGKFDITQPTLSYHMKKLTDCELVKVRKQGTWNYYSLNEERVGSIEQFVQGFKNAEKNVNCSCGK